MNKEEFKLNDKALQEAIDNLKGTQFLDAFCILDWIIKTRDENKLLKQKVNQLETNRDEAIELVKEIKLHYQQHPTMIPSVKIDKLLSLLERGKE